MRLTATHKMGIAALIMAGSVFLSRLMGLVRDKVVSWQFGAGAESDVYFAAFVVPDFLNYLLAGGYISITLIPLLSKRFEEDEADGWRFFSAVFWWAALGIAALTAVAWLFAPELARIVGPGFSPEKQARLAHFLRIILPAQVFFLPGACVSALLYIRKQFLAPALTPLIYNGCIIAGGLLVTGRGMEGFCWGVLFSDRSCCLSWRPAPPAPLCPKAYPPGCASASTCATRSSNGFSCWPCRSCSACPLWPWMSSSCVFSAPWRARGR